MTGIAGCCARAANGHVTAELATTLMKSRRRIAAPGAIAGRDCDVRFVPKADIASPADLPPKPVIRSVELIVQPNAHDVVGERVCVVKVPAKRCGRRLAQPGQKFSEQRKSDCRQRGGPQRDNNG
jgi:hypothetical protein